jgi:alanyl-tRNA synthetase
VRVVSFGEEEGISAELCGGTHVDSTAEIGSFRVVAESSVAAGVRRIEVVTGRAAEQLVAERLRSLATIAELTHSKPATAAAAVQELLAHQQTLQKELAQLRQKLARHETHALLDKAEQIGGFAVLSVRVEAPDTETLRQMTDWFRDKLGSSVVAVGALLDEKPLIVAAVTEDLVSRGMHAGQIVREAAKLMGGGGGGRPTLAQAGGRHSDQLEAALQSIVRWVHQNVKSGDDHQTIA